MYQFWRNGCFTGVKSSHTFKERKEEGKVSNILSPDLGADRSQKEPYRENIGNEEGFQIHIQSQQSWQPVTCGQERCPARAENHESVFLASFLQFPGVAASTRLHNMHRLSFDLAEDNQS